MPLCWYGSNSRGDIPNDPGAYVLEISLKKAVQFSVSTLGNQLLPPGRYFWGSVEHGAKPDALDCQVANSCNRFCCYRTSLGGGAYVRLALSQAGKRLGNYNQLFGKLAAHRCNPKSYTPYRKDDKYKIRILNQPLRENQKDNVVLRRYTGNK